MSVFLFMKMRELFFFYILEVRREGGKSNVLFTKRGSREPAGSTKRYVFLCHEWGDLARVL